MFVNEIEFWYHFNNLILKKNNLEVAGIFYDTRHRIVLLSCRSMYLERRFSKTNLNNSNVSIGWSIFEAEIPDS